MLVIGSFVSPYARKAIVALTHKGIAHEIDPITPFFGNDDFSRISPLRRIPVLVDGDRVFNDSTVICEYLDERFPEPPLMPKSPEDRARARWLEEYADSRLGDVIIWKFFFRLLVAPKAFGVQPDMAAVAEARDVLIPQALDWIETQAPEHGFLFDHVCTADITYAAFFRNALLAGFEIDAERWPKTAAWLKRVEAVPAFAETIRYEQIIVTTPYAERSAALRAAGARISETSVAERAARASIMLEPA